MTRVTVVLLAAFVVVACTRAYCMDFSSRCDGNTVVPTCADTTIVTRQECGPKKCIEGVDENGGSFAFCSLDGCRDERCSRNGAFCDGDRLVFCESVYPTDERDCADAGLLCATDASVGTCVVSHASDPRCPSTASFCAGDVVTACFGDLAAPRQDCKANGTFCRTNDVGADCVLDPDPDPRCASATRFCDGTRGFECFGGFRQRLAGDCAPAGKTCVATADYFGCR